jgi:ribosome-associated protein
MQAEALTELVVGALEDLKGQDIRVLDVRGKTSITDVLVLATGTSNRHVKALAEAVVEQAKAAGQRPLGVEGQDTAEWVLVDLVDVVVHVMLAQVRDFYNLEKLWAEQPPAEDAGSGESGGTRTGA